MYIAISGNIGSGKTSLVEMLSRRLGYEPFFERIDNPYLDSFYQDMARWSFNLQMSFLSKKTMQVKEIMNSGNDIIQDRTIFEEAYVFVRNLNRMGLMSTPDYELYMSFFDLLAAGIRRPDAIVYLKASIPTLISQIRRRGREYEMGIQPEYLEGLNELYDDWIAGYDGRVITIDVDKYDFVLSPDHFEAVTGKITEALALPGGGLSLGEAGLR
ncbi:MAG: deoxynucleoside kinase [Rikenellaceae bacterium]|nr:deoxynucleoside kinase [Rikenellaceae bacterium]